MNYKPYIGQVVVIEHFAPKYNGTIAQVLHVNGSYALVLCYKNYPECYTIEVYWESELRPAIKQDTYFPILVQYDGYKKPTVVMNPLKIKPGKSFKVLKTNYRAKLF